MVEFNQFDPSGCCGSGTCIVPACSTNSCAPCINVVFYSGGFSYVHKDATNGSLIAEDLGYVPCKNISDEHRPWGCGEFLRAPQTSGIFYGPWGSQVGIYELAGLTPLVRDQDRWYPWGHWNLRYKHDLSLKYSHCTKWHDPESKRPESFIKNAKDEQTICIWHGVICPCATYNVFYEIEQITHDEDGYELDDYIIAPEDLVYPDPPDIRQPGVVYPGDPGTHHAYFPNYRPEQHPGVTIQTPETHPNLLWGKKTLVYRLVVEGVARDGSLDRPGGISRENEEDLSDGRIIWEGREPLLDPHEPNRGQTKWGRLLCTSSSPSARWPGRRAFSSDYLLAEAWWLDDTNNGSPEKLQIIPDYKSDEKIPILLNGDYIEVVSEHENGGHSGAIYQCILSRAGAVFNSSDLTVNDGATVVVTSDLGGFNASMVGGILTFGTEGDFEETTYTVVSVVNENQITINSNPGVRSGAAGKIQSLIDLSLENYLNIWLWLQVATQGHNLTLKTQLTWNTLTECRLDTGPRNISDPLKANFSPGGGLSAHVGATPNITDELSAHKNHWSQENSQATFHNRFYFSNEVVNTFGYDQNLGSTFVKIHTALGDDPKLQKGSVFMYLGPVLGAGAEGHWEHTVLFEFDDLKSAGTNYVTSLKGGFEPNVEGQHLVISGSLDALEEQHIHYGEQFKIIEYVSGSTLILDREASWPHKFLLAPDDLTTVDDVTLVVTSVEGGFTSEMIGNICVIEGVHHLITNVVDTNTIVFQSAPGLLTGSSGLITAGKGTGIIEERTWKLGTPEGDMPSIDLSTFNYLDPINWWWLGIHPEEESGIIDDAWIEMNDAEKDATKTCWNNNCSGSDCEACSQGSNPTTQISVTIQGGLTSDYHVVVPFSEHDLGPKLTDGIPDTLWPRDLVGVPSDYSNGCENCEDVGGTYVLELAMTAGTHGYNTSRAMERCVWDYCEDDFCLAPYDNMASGDKRQSVNVNGSWPWVVSKRGRCPGDCGIDSCSFPGSGWGVCQKIGPSHTVAAIQFFDSLDIHDPFGPMDSEISRKAGDKFIITVSYSVGTYACAYTLQQDEESWTSILVGLKHRIGQLQPYGTSNGERLIARIITSFGVGGDSHAGESPLQVTGQRVTPDFPLLVISGHGDTGHVQISTSIEPGGNRGCENCSMVVKQNFDDSNWPHVGSPGSGGAVDPSDEFIPRYGNPTLGIQLVMKDWEGPCPNGGIRMGSGKWLASGQDQSDFTNARFNHAWYSHLASYDAYPPGEAPGSACFDFEESNKYNGYWPEYKGFTTAYESSKEFELRIGFDAGVECQGATMGFLTSEGYSRGKARSIATYRSGKVNINECNEPITLTKVATNRGFKSWGWGLGEDHAGVVQYGITSDFWFDESQGSILTDRHGDPIPMGGGDGIGFYDFWPPVYTTIGGIGRGSEVYEGPVRSGLYYPPGYSAGTIKEGWGPCGPFDVGPFHPEHSDPDAVGSYAEDAWEVPGSMSDVWPPFIKYPYPDMHAAWKAGAAAAHSNVRNAGPPGKHDTFYGDYYKPNYDKGMSYDSPKNYWFAGNHGVWTPTPVKGDPGVWLSDTYKPNADWPHNVFIWREEATPGNLANSWVFADPTQSGWIKLWGYPAYQQVRTTGGHFMSLNAEPGPPILHGAYSGAGMLCHDVKWYEYADPNRPASDRVLPHPHYKHSSSKHNRGFCGGELGGSVTVTSLN